MRYNLSFLFCLLISQISLGQFHFTGMGGAHFNGLARAGLSVEGIGAIYYNQAGLSGIKKWAVDMSFERRFNLNDLSAIQIAGAKRFGFGTLGILFSQFGTEVYNEQLYGLSYGRLLGKNISLGGMICLFGFHLQNGGSTYTASFALGSTVKLDKQLYLSTHIFSPVNVAITEENQIPTRFRAGLTYTPSPKVFLFAEIDKELNRKQWEYKLAVSYQVISKLNLQLGFNPKAEFYSFGIGYQPFQKFTMRGSGSIHQVLGISPALSLSYGE